ncbi:hypothetical protein BCU63_01630 [Vibrio splendidus]|nr:hypothetical protein BCU63_01630 [Vibrio splendidus]
MLVKFFTPTQSKGALGGLDYLLDENRNTKPEVLYGNPEITKGLLLNSTFKNPYTAGCLSFAEEESQIDKSLQDELMQSFEETLLAGLEGNQYDIIWIKHDDKGRLELNFHILNTELQTGKRLQPYLHQFDRPRIEAWKSLQNDLYLLADPNAPERKRMLAPGVFKQEWQSVKNAVHNYLEDAWVNNEINNRSDLLDEISNNLGGEIKRKGKYYISVKFPDVKKNIRLKGELYDEHLTQCEKSTEQKEKNQKSYDSERESRIERNRNTVDRLNQRTREHRNEKYKQVARAPEETKDLFKMVNADIAAYNDSVNIRKPDLQSNVAELRKRVSSMQKLPSNERSQDTVLQTIESTNNNNKESEHGKNIRDSARRIRANSIANRITASRLQRNSEKLRELARQVIKSIQQRFRAKQLRITKDKQSRSDRDITDRRPEVEHLQNLRKRKTDSFEQGL